MLYNDTTEKYYLVKWGVNMRGPYFEDLLEKYELNIIYGKTILNVITNLNNAFCNRIEEFIILYFED